MKPAEADLKALRAGPATRARIVRPRIGADWRGRVELLAARAAGGPLPELALGLFCLALVALTWGTWGDLAMDTGYDLLAASRTAAGEAPYADYVYFYGPAAPYLLGGMFALFGTSIEAAAALGLVLAAAIVVATYLLGRTLAGRPGALLAAALTATAAFSSANNSFVLPHTLSAPLAVLLCLGALLAAMAVARGRGPGWLVAAGTLAGLVTLARAEFTLAIFATLLVWLGLRALAATDRRAAARQALLVALPALAVPLLAYGAGADPRLARRPDHREPLSGRLPARGGLGGAQGPRALHGRQLRRAVGAARALRGRRGNARGVAAWRSRGAGGAARPRSRSRYWARWRSWPSWRLARRPFATTSSSPTPGSRPGRGWRWRCCCGATGAVPAPGAPVRRASFWRSSSSRPSPPRATPPSCLSPTPTSRPTRRTCCRSPARSSPGCTCASCSRARPRDAGAVRALGAAWLALLVLASAVLVVSDAQGGDDHRRGRRRRAHGPAEGRRGVSGRARHGRARDAARRAHPRGSADDLAVHDLRAREPAAPDVAAPRDACGRRGAARHRRSWRRRTSGSRSPTAHR